MQRSFGSSSDRADGTTISTELILFYSRKDRPLCRAEGPARGQYEYGALFERFQPFNLWNITWLARINY